MRSLFKIFKKPTQSSLHMVNFPDYEYFNDVDIAYSDITPDKNKIAPFKEASRLNIDEQLYKEPKINV